MKKNLKVTVFKKGIIVMALLTMIFNFSPQCVRATCQSKEKKCNGYGKLIVNVWRTTTPTESGNTLQWDYQVSSVYKGKKKVKEIRTTWYCSADLRKSASISLSIGPGAVSASAGTSWQTVKTESHYWSNTNGAKSSSYRSDVCVGPKKNYEKDSICTFNTGKLQLKIGKKSYSASYTASV